MMSKGRRPARLTKVERADQQTKQLEAMAMALRLNQMMVQNLNRKADELTNGLRTATTMINDFQYRWLALQQATNQDPVILQRLADELKIADFNKEVFRKDEEENAVSVDVVESDEDVVIITSTTPEAGVDNGILRSRIKIAEMNQADLMAALRNKRIGDKVETSLNGVKHVIEILGIRRSPVAEKVELQAV